MKITNEQLERFRDLIHDEAGIVLSGEKYRNRLRKNVKKRMRKLDIEETDEYYDYVWFSENSDDELENLINTCVVNETLFYRNGDQMEILKNQVFPKLARIRKTGSKEPIRIVSAGCSNGAEPYSLVMAYMESARSRNFSLENPGLRVLGLDISTQALNDAREGIYEERPVRNAPDWVVQQYFESTEDGFQVVDRVQEQVDFRYINLVHSRPPQNQDIIFHRNVLIYFEPDLREQIVDKLHHSLKDQGLLFVGHSEDLSSFDEYFRPTRWGNKRIYEKWTTDRRLDSIWSADSSDNVSSAIEERREPIYEKDDPQVSTELLDEDTQNITVSGVVGKNISAVKFAGRLQHGIHPTRDSYLFDLRQVPYISNRHLRQFAKIIEKLNKPDTEIQIVTDDDRIIEWIHQNWDDHEVRLEKTPDRSQRTTGGFSRDDDSSSERVTSGQEDGDSSENRSEYSGESLVNRYLDNGGEDEEVSREDSTSHSRTSTSEPATINTRRRGSKMTISLEGRFDADNDSSLVQNLKEEVMELARKAQNRTNIEVLEVDFSGLEYIDREYVNILQRARTLARGEPFEIEWKPGPSSVQQALERWGFISSNS